MLKTLHVRAGDDVRPIGAPPSTAHPDYRVSSNGVALGAGKLDASQVSGSEYLGLPLSHRSWARAVERRLGRAAGQDGDDVMAQSWNPYE